MPNKKAGAPYPLNGSPATSSAEKNNSSSTKKGKREGFFASFLSSLGQSGDKAGHSRKVSTVSIAGTNSSSYLTASGGTDSTAGDDRSDLWLKSEGWKEIDTVGDQHAPSPVEGNEKKSRSHRPPQINVTTNSDSFYDVGSAASAGDFVVSAVMQAAKEAPSPMVTPLSSTGSAPFPKPLNSAEGPAMMINTDDPVVLEALLESDSLSPTNSAGGRAEKQGLECNGTRSDGEAGAGEWTGQNGELVQGDVEVVRSDCGGVSEGGDELSMDDDDEMSGSGSSGLLPIPPAPKVYAISDDGDRDKDDEAIGESARHVASLGISEGGSSVKKRKAKGKRLGGAGSTHSSNNTLCSEHGGRDSRSMDSSIPSSSESDGEELMVDASLLIPDSVVNEEGTSAAGGDEAGGKDTTQPDGGCTESTLSSSFTSSFVGTSQSILNSSVVASEGSGAGGDNRAVAGASDVVRESWQEVTLDPKLWGDYLKVDVVERDRYGFRLDEEIATNEIYARKHAERIERARSSWDMFYRKPGFRSTLLCKSDELKQFIRKNGIPYNRGQLWMELSGCRQYKKRNESDYHEMLQRAEAGELDPDIKRQIEKDLRRTFPENEWYESEEGIQSLGRLLSAFSVGYPEVGYMQSINFIAGLLLLFMAEEDAYHMLRTITGSLLPNEYYADNMIGLQTDIRVFDELLAKKLPNVSAHLKAIGCSTSFFTTQWFLCLFVNALPLECTLRIWDCFFCEGSKVLFRFGMAIVHLVSNVILESRDGIEASCQMKEEVRKIYDVDLLVRTAFESGWMGRVSRSAIRRSREKHRKAVVQQCQLDPNALKDLMAGPKRMSAASKDATARETIVGNLLSFFGENLNDIGAGNTPSRAPGMTDFFV